MGKKVMSNDGEAVQPGRMVGARHCDLAPDWRGDLAPDWRGDQWLIQIVQLGAIIPEDFAFGLPTYIGNFHKPVKGLGEGGVKMWEVR